MSKTDYFKPLTGYRAMAAYMVFCVHFNHFEKGTFLNSFFSGFGIGVPLFFALSGFLIYTRYYTSEISIPFYKRYMTNRFARIYPVYFLITTFTLLFNYKAAAFTPYWMKVYFLNITFLRGFFDKYISTLVVQGSSLTVEEVFYIVAPIIFLLGRGSIRRYLVVFGGIFGLGWILSFISVDLLHGFFWSNHKFMILKTFFGLSFSFIIGIIVGLLNNRIKDLKFKYVTIVGFVGLFLSLILLSQLKDLTVHEVENISWQWILVYNFFSIPFIGAIIWGLVREVTWVSRLMSTEVFQVLGKSSYSFYLIHFGCIHAIVLKFIPENVFLLFFIILILSIILWRLVEEPMNEKIRSGAQKYLGI